MAQIFLWLFLNHTQSCSKMWFEDPHFDKMTHWIDDKKVSVDVWRRCMHLRDRFRSKGKLVQVRGITFRSFNFNSLSIFDEATIEAELSNPSGKRVFVVDHDACDADGNAYMSCTWAYVSDESNNLFYLCWNKAAKFARNGRAVWGWAPEFGKYRTESATRADLAKQYTAVNHSVESGG